jgi:zinc transport system ATP-binding protein
MTKILEIKNLSVKLGRVTVLENISFEINKGEVVAIIGPNGAGKTTLFKAILGIVPFDGQIIWEGDVERPKPRLGYVPQRLDYDRTFPLTVKEFFLLKSKRTGFWFPSDAALSGIDEAMSLTNCNHLINKQIGQLSAGELQKVFIAYAIYEKPELLLFDEPTSGIDIGGETTVYSLLHKVSTELNLTILLISHDLSVVFEHANQVICLNKTLCCYGTPHNILTPQHLKRLYGESSAFYSHAHHKHKD